MTAWRTCSGLSSTHANADVAGRHQRFERTLPGDKGHLLFAYLVLNRLPGPDFVDVEAAIEALHRAESHVALSAGGQKHGIVVRAEPDRVVPDREIRHAGSLRRSGENDENVSTDPLESPVSMRVRTGEAEDPAFAGSLPGTADCSMVRGPQCGGARRDRRQARVLSVLLQCHCGPGIAVQDRARKPLSHVALNGNRRSVLRCTPLTSGNNAADGQREHQRRVVLHRISLDTLAGGRLLDEVSHSGQAASYGRPGPHAPPAQPKAPRRRRHDNQRVLFAVRVDTDHIQESRRRAHRRP